MANPRKFSEKIALHNQKQAEETAAFEQIMREVNSATRSGGQVKNQHLHITQSVGSLRAGSLPNVNHIGTNADRSSIDLQTALNNLEDIRRGREPRERRHHSPSTQHRSSPHNVHHGGHHRQSHFDQKRIDSSPYSTVYLSPPPADTTWRRTNSDSALHQSAMLSEQELDFHSGSSPRRSVEISNSTHISWDPGKKLPAHLLNQHLLTASLPNERPKSCDVPGITIYPSQEDPNALHHHIPISSNTGSLPDLTNLHFPAPLTTPIDVDDQTLLNNSDHTPSSPYDNVATTYSCGSNFDPRSPYSPGSPQNNSTFSPPPNQQSRNLIMQTRINNGVVNGNHVNAIIDDCRVDRDSSPTLIDHSRSQNDVVILDNGRFRPRVSSPHCEQQGLTMDTNALSLDGRSPQYESTTSTSQQHQVFGFPPNNQHQSVPHGQCYESDSSVHHNADFNRQRTATPSDHSCSAPTSPVSHSLSPISSPGLTQNMAPLSKSPFTDNSYYNVQQTNVLQHQLEQFKMVPGADLQDADHYLMMPDHNGHSSSSSASSSTGVLYVTSAASLPQSPRSVDVTSDYSPQQSPQSTLVSSSGDPQQPSTIYYSTPSQGSTSILPTTAPLVYSKSVISSSTTYQQPSSTTSVTNHSPTSHTASIPDIILTECCVPDLCLYEKIEVIKPANLGPNVEDPLLRNQDFAKDIGTAMASMSGSFDTNDLFSSAEEAFRAGLDPIDFDGLQILTDIADGTTDDAFRLERN
ncbi:CREB-regulated transcription coactivator 1-like protein [Leptotrombidium deliense]|uniref:CREB-regulated transcription coactivator 1-like protein n=1 Tax=Leptotrombidium deliense TaxID=299467 RepID=A0A443SP30_9ACAR|nr:CREB-regulated transcription coactivator 1-like protein [Leptotrombidium deliense]